MKSYSLPFWGLNIHKTIWKTSAWELCLFSFINLLNYLFLSVWAHEYLPHMLGYKTVLLYFVTQIFPVLATVNSFSWHLYSFDILWLLCMFMCAHTYVCLSNFLHYGTNGCSRLICTFPVIVVDSAIFPR